MNKHLEHILRTMCYYANVDFSKLDTSQELWFDNYVWSYDVQDKFSKWLEDYMSTNKEARKQLMRTPTSNKKMIRKFVEDFILNYGFKAK
jgi:hypothetical protein